MVIFVLMFSIGKSQSVKEKATYITRGKELTFYEDGTYVHNCRYEDYDIRLTSEINPISCGYYTKIKRKTYRLNSNSQYTSSNMVIAGNEYHSEASSIRIVLVDSTKSASESFFISSMVEFTSHEYYYVVKLIYDKKVIDSFSFVKYFELTQDPDYGDKSSRDSAFVNECRKMVDSYKSEGVDIVNGACQQAQVVYGQECEFTNRAGLPIEWIEVDIHSYSESFTCRYKINDPAHNYFELAIPYFAYQCMFHNSYNNRDVKILNRNTIEFDALQYKKVKPQQE